MTLREALLAPLPVGTYEGEAPASAPLPWTVAVLDIPTPSDRALAGSVMAHRARMRVTVAAANAHACMVLAEKVRALEGTRVDAEGWTCSPLRHVNSRPVERDPQVTFPATNTAAFYAVLEFELTASARPAL
ncbi:hypothetical protein [Cellulomonas palmilytica]|uniref:hypothetical protein n=1 Tax=Cellulomonas palmilytica TaxID=2608402 RepID=UPI001F27D9AE|nr:hypothetical protein [Cellulomonas palmilytica]UJP39329.1 hypothetical protein F1D97_13420 [Cellulomonas palmilytica]